MRIEPETIVRAILSAPGWARVGITAPKERLREEAAQELARVILMEREAEGPSSNQLKFTL